MNMDISVLTNEDKVFIRTIFYEMRNSLQEFCKDREFVLSNPQLFTFVTFSPVALAIASDEVVDIAEITALEKIAKTIDVKNMVGLELIEFMSIANEPDNCITNEEFNIRVGSEILFLCRNMKKYEAAFLSAAKALLTFDLEPGRDTSMTKSFAIMMDSLIEGNASVERQKQLEKLNKIKAELNI